MSNYSTSKNITTGKRRGATQLRSESLEPRHLLAGDVVISEFLAVNTNGLQDRDGDFTDWIELKNETQQVVDLEGWYLTDDLDVLSKWKLPAVSIAANAYMIVRASGKDVVDPNSSLHTNFSLAGGGEFLGLVEPDGKTIASSFAPEFPPQSADVSYGVSLDGEQQGYFPLPTPGAANSNAPVVDPERQIVINEIMYHPSSENDLEEYVELVNQGTQSISLKDWRISGGIDIAFPDTTLAAGEYLVVAADVNAFQAKYGNAIRVIGPWTGRLSNSSDRITLRNASDDRIDRVEFADSGDWSVRELGPDDRGTQGWQWSDAHDGQGMSLELTNPSTFNEYGQAWKASTVEQGTPGRQNSVLTNDVAPFILSTTHSPIIPHSNDVVTVTSRIVARQTESVQAVLRWRLDGAPEFSRSPMNDLGQAGDAVAGDQVYSATIPAHADLSVVEFYVEATNQRITRTWPAATLASGQVTNALFQVIDSYDTSAPWIPGQSPVYFEVMTGADRERFTAINRLSDAEMNATFISATSDGLRVRYNTGIRIRGSGSRRANPPNNRINFPGDQLWQGVSAINLNVDHVENQIAGSVLFRMAGLQAAEAKPVRMFSNGVDLFGGLHYAQVEPLNSDMANNQFPLDSGGNLYKGRRPNESPPGGAGAGLAYNGPDPLPYGSYIKLTNSSQADWSDVIQLTDVLNNAPDETYLQDIESVINVEQWLRFFAMNAVIGNTEGGLVNGDRAGDDYAMYRGIEDPRFVMIPHDLDSVLSARTWSLTRASGVPALNRFLFHPEIRPRYYQAVRDLVDEVLLNEQTPLILDQAIGMTRQGEIDRVQAFLASRAEYILSILPDEIEINSRYPRQNDYLISERSSIELHGRFPDQAKSVLVNGEEARFSLNNDWEFGSSVRTAVPTNATWKYLDNGSDQGTAWKDFNFVPNANWKEGTGQFGYGDGDEATIVEFGGDEANKHITTYFRHEFDIPESFRHLDLTLFLLSDDGAVFYLNGEELVRNNMPEGPINHETLALTQITGSNERVYRPHFVNTSLLRDGKNVLAVEIHQVTADDPDLSFQAYMRGRFINPGTGIDLSPGVSRVVVEATDGVNGSGNVIASTTLDFWYNDGSVQEIPGGELPAGETMLRAADGPYLVSGDLTVPAGAKLTIEPGTSVYFANNVELIVNGTLNARGERNRRIQFTSDPTAPFVPDMPTGREGLPNGPPRWKGIHFVNSLSPENVIAHADIAYAQHLDGSIGVKDSLALIDDVSFRGTHLRMINASNASMIVQNSTFPDMFSDTESPAALGLDNIAEHIKIVGRTPQGGLLIIRNNKFGVNKGHNDVIDADSHRRGEGPILQILNNEFSGAGDELLDLGGDVLVSGNIFRNVFKDQDTSDRGYANAISTGDAGANTTIVVTKNVFYEVDHAINLKNLASTIFENNTVVNVHADFVDRFDNPNVGSAINLFVDEPNAVAGKGAYAAGNIFWNVPRVFGNADLPAGQVSAIQMERNLIDADDISIGARAGTVFSLSPTNFDGDPRFADLQNQDFSLSPGSDAIGAFLGHDLGWKTDDRISISGAPQSPTSSNVVNLTVGGAGFFSYQYRINGGNWSPQTPIGNGFDPNGTIRTGTISLAGLPDGEYVIEVRGRDFAGNEQASPTATDPFVIRTGRANVIINEVLADNRGAVVNQGSVPDAVELYNAGDRPANLKGFGLSDRENQPARFVFAADTMIQPGQHLVLYADDLVALPGTHLGFGFDSDGDGLFLFADATGAATLVDSVEFGPQVGNFSIGRIGTSRQWELNEPTLGESNRSAKTGDASLVRLNEWLAVGDGEDDFLELYNNDSLPVAIGGFFLTDEPGGAPQRHQIQANSFIGAKGFARFIADATPADGSDHVNFRLSSEHEVLALNAPDGSQVDVVAYYPQAVGVSQGRFPDGANAFQYFESPTPGWANGIGLPGDFDADGLVSVPDMDLLCGQIRSGNADLRFDLNRDGRVNQDDQRFFLLDLLNTSAGDANLDGSFNSADLVTVFIAGEYEDGIAGNSTWQEGDWNCDGEFGTRDLVAAFQDGRYTAAAHSTTANSQPVESQSFAIDQVLAATDFRDEESVHPSATDSAESSAHESSVDGNKAEIHSSKQHEQALDLIAVARNQPVQNDESHG